MTLTAVKSSTNWSPKDLQVLQRMKKNYSEMDERSGRPWKLGDDLLLLDKVAQGRDSGGQFLPTESAQAARDAASYIGCAHNTLVEYGRVSAAWPVPTRRDAVIWSIFKLLASQPDRVQILARLVKEYGIAGLTHDLVLRSLGRSPTQRPQGSTERLQAFYTILERFPTRLKARDALLARQIINRLYVLLGEAEEEAV